MKRKLNNPDLYLRIIPDPVLYQVCEPIDNFTDDLILLIDDMISFMNEYDGIGLSANQVGILKRIIVVRNGDDVIAMINPKILSQSDKLCSYEEGCLSVPDVYYSVDRPSEIDVEYYDVEGNKHNVHANEIFARIILHEIDHLNGIVFIDHLSRLKKNIVEKKFEKLAKSRKI